MSDIRKPDTTAEEAARDEEQNREATADGETLQEFEAEREAADSRPAFGDDKVTPRLNDGR